MNSNTNEEIGAESECSDAELFEIKIFFGVMYGSELVLPEGDYFFITKAKVADNESEQEYRCDDISSASFVHKTLYLSGSAKTPNFLLTLKKSADKYVVVTYSENGAARYYNLKNNEVFCHDGVYFAVKKSGEKWSDEVNGFARDNTFTHKIRYIWGGGKRNFIILSLLILLFLSVFFFWSESQQDEREQKNLSWSKVPWPLHVVDNPKTHSRYILVNNVHEMDWVHGALLKVKEGNKAIPVLLPKVQKSIIDELYFAGFPVLQINFSDPQNPVLYLSRQIVGSESDALKKILFEKLPFLTAITFSVCDKNDLLEQARQGLIRLNIAFKQVKTTGGYALVAQESLNDHQLFSLNNFIKNFYEQWGDKYISFSINLNENWLQNKSYLENVNGDGYVFLGPSHWFFPLTK
ncbi:hypothetical protein DV589_24730 [Salmonella enterica]|nr:hypothetical protein [Salmonella enterica]EKF0976914.1 hypothetical protein [Salmonella enterica]